MAQDPRKYLVNNCPPTLANSKSAANERRDFFDSIGKIGDLEALNVIGGGKVGAGLRELEKISDSVRAGDPALPQTVIGGSIDKGANFVLAQTGIDNTFVQSVSEFNPGAANLALNTAKQIYSRVRDGSYKVEDIPDALQSLQQLEVLGRSIFSPRKANEPAFRDLCVSPYATDLIKLAPKYKFLFVCEFVFNDPYTMVDNVSAALVKRFTRPQITFDYEDLNMYNFRTKLRKSTMYQPLEMEIHDDIENNSMDFFVQFVNAISPVSNLTTEDYTTNLVEERGMFFGNNPDGTPVKNYAASIAPLSQGNRTILTQIVLYHLFNYGRFMNVYRFFRPKPVEITFDEVNMEEGTAGNTITGQFAYDSVNFERRALVGTTQNQELITKASDLGGLFPLRYVGDTVAGESDTSNDEFTRTIQAGTAT